MASTSWLSVLLFFLMFRIGIGQLFTATFRLSSAFEEEINTTKMVLERMKKDDSDTALSEFASFIEGTHLKHSNIGQDSTVTYMAHPINIYHVIKRMVIDWPERVESLGHVADIQGSRALLDELLTITTGELWPRPTDFEGVTLQLISIQAVYLLDIVEFATGTLNGTRTEPLTLDEIFSIGRFAYDRNLFYEASLWFRGLGDCFKKGIKGEVATMKKALKNLASAYHRYENYIKSVEAINEALMYEPDDQSLKNDLKYYVEKLEAARNEGKEPDKTLKLNPSGNEVPYRDSFDNYYALCREDIKRPPLYMKRLKCRWKKTLVPYRPAKQEFLNIRPPVVLYHDVISDNEIEQVKNIAKRTMTKSTLAVPQGTGNTLNTNIRVSETSWIDDSRRVIARISRRVQEITGLSTKLADVAPHAEQMQVLNYGIGGMYQPRHDYLNSDPRRNRPKEDPYFLNGAGDRIATWMFYGSDVDVGGNTVFPLLNVTVPVTKGSAVFWPNMYLNGTVDWRTLHAECPVAIGSKWVMNKWLRENGQFNKWPCSTNKRKAIKLI
ncbi:prolyl 4-hydroxylase subunit alpha-2-like [Lineus longissimus]|uniref:prolyl 4-hydroxylase subunit alpha-2-like n=1 Tax=Lineus longissimus TaxID=88925 RepID=UPI002B4D108C